MRKIFVFGSNLVGRHGAGSAYHAHQYWGAVYGEGVGYHGDSYAIPTKDHEIKTMPLFAIRPYVEDFLDFAKHRPDLEFNVVAIGCGLAGMKANDIAPLFKNAPENCKLPPEFIEILCPFF